MNIYKGGRCDEWGTPPDLLEAIGLTDAFDVCASADNHKFPEYWTKADNCLRRPWPRKKDGKTCWMNPPFSSAYSFFQKAAKEAAEGSVIFAIYKASNLETKTWQEAIFPHASCILFLKGRTNYVMEGKGSKGVPFGSAIIMYNTWPLPHHKMRNLGTLLNLRFS